MTVLDREVLWKLTGVCLIFCISLLPSHHSAPPPESQGLRHCLCRRKAVRRHAQSRRTLNMHTSPQEEHGVVAVHSVRGERGGALIQGAEVASQGAATARGRLSPIASPPLRLSASLRRSPMAYRSLRRESRSFDACHALLGMERAQCRVAPDGAQWSL